MPHKVEISIKNDPSVEFKLVKVEIHVDNIEEKEGVDLKVYLKKRHFETLC